MYDLQWNQDYCKHIMYMIYDLFNHLLYLLKDPYGIKWGKRNNGFVEDLEMSEINFKAAQSPTEVQKDQLM